MYEKKLFIAICILGYVTSSFTSEIQKSDLAKNLVVFFDPQAVGYSSDCYTEDLSAGACNTGCNTSGPKLKPGAVAGSLEWAEIQRLAAIENEKFQQVYMPLYAIQGKYQQIVNLTSTEESERQKLYSKLDQLLAEHTLIMNELGKRCSIVMERFEAIAIRIAKNLGAIAVLNCHPVYIHPQYDITRESLAILNREYLETSSRI